MEETLEEFKERHNCAQTSTEEFIEMYYEALVKINKLEKEIERVKDVEYGKGWRDATKTHNQKVIK